MATSGESLASPGAVPMNVVQRRSSTGLGLLLFTGSAIAAPYGAIGAGEILLGLLLICWIGFPLLLLGALAVQAIRSLFATPEHPTRSSRRPTPT